MHPQNPDPTQQPQQSTEPMGPQSTPPVLPPAHVESQDSSVGTYQVANTEPVFGIPTPEESAATPGIVFGSAISSAPSQTSSASADAMPKRRRVISKKLLLIVSTLAVVFMGGGAALAYTYVKNTPDMILRDAFYNSTKQKTGGYQASVDVKSNSSAATIRATGSWDENLFSSDISATNDEFIKGKTVTAHFVTGKDRVYFKIDKLRELLAQAFPEQKDLLAHYNGMLSLIDTKWVVVTEDDLEEYLGVKRDEDKKRSQCIETAIETYRNDKTQQKEVYDVYTQNRFLQFEKQADDSVNDRATYHFSVTLDRAKVKGFAAGLEKTTVYKAIRTCADPDGKDTSSASDSVDDAIDETNDEPLPVVDMWVDKTSRTLRKVQVVYTDVSKYTKDKTTITSSVTFDFSKAVAVVAPKADTTVKQLMDEMNKLETSQPAPVSRRTSQPVLGARDYKKERQTLVTNFTERLKTFLPSSLR